jgi:3-dehydroquinate synthase
VILDLVEGTDPAELTADSAVLRELVERAIRVKVDVVVADLRETGGQTGGDTGGGHPGREALNYGHTMAHAIERVEDYRVRHGEAVAMGCVFVAELAARAGTLAPDVVERHHRTFARVGLPTRYDGAGFEELHAAMRVDKKARGSQLRFVVLDELARPRVLAGPAEADLRAAYEALVGGPR